MKGLKNHSIVTAVALWFCSVTVFADALDNWHWLNPAPAGTTLNGITFAANQFVAVGDGGWALTSPNGINWVSAATPSGNALNAVTYGNGQYVAVGANGIIETSPNGTNWVAAASGTTASLDAVAYGGGVFAAAGSGGTIIISTNGVNWTATTSGITGNIIGMAWGNGTFVGVCSGSVLLSANGVDWTSQSLTGVGVGPIAFLNGLFMVEGNQVKYGMYGQPIFSQFVYSSPDGTGWVQYNLPVTGTIFIGSYPFIAYGNGIYFDGSHISNDGQTWSGDSASGYSGGNSAGNACVYGNGTFVAVGGHGKITISANATSWTNATAGAQSILTSVTYGNGVYVAVGGAYAVPTVYYDSSYYAVTNAVLWATNDFQWHAVAPFTTNALASVIFTNGLFTAVGQNGIFQSTNGINWLQRSSGTVNALHEVVAGNGLLVAVGDNGTIQTSASGLAWTGRFSGTSDHLFAVTYGNGLYVATGSQGTILTSPDGSSWSAQYSGVATNLYAATYGGAGFVAAGEGGVVITSPDGVNWTSQNSGTSMRINSLSYGNGFYVAACTPFLPVITVSTPASELLTSLNGVLWSPRINRTPDDLLLGAAFINNQFVTVGGNGNILASDNTATMPLSLLIEPAVNGPGLYIFAPLGSSFHLQASPSLTTPSWTNIGAFTNASAVTQWTDSQTNLSERFYRAVSP